MIQAGSEQGDIMKLIKRLFGEHEGATAIEYGLIAALATGLWYAGTHLLG